MVRNLTDHDRIKFLLRIFVFFIFVIASCGKEKTVETKTASTDSLKTPESKVDAGGITTDFIISYDLEGLLKGKMEIFRNGDRLKQKINSEIMGNKNSNVIYIKDKIVYSVIDVGGKKFGTKTDLVNYNSIKQTGETITDFNEFEKFLDSKKITGTENILGYKCDIYEISDPIRLSVYNKRYIMKIKTPEFIATATNLNTRPVFSENEFEVPLDVNFNKTDSKGIDSRTLDSIVSKIRK